MPKAVRLMLCAAIPEAMAIIASIVIHAIVNHSTKTPPGSALSVRHPEYGRRASAFRNSSLPFHGLNT